MKPIRIQIVFLLVISILTGCRTNSRDSIPSSQEATNHRNKPTSFFQDSLFIHGDAAVFYYPDSIQLQTIKEVTNPQIFDGTFHELEYQIKFSKKTLQSEWPKLAIIDARKVRFIVFNKVNGTSSIVDLNNYNDPEGLFIFNGIKDPILVDMTNLSQGLEYYFNVK